MYSWLPLVLVVSGCAAGDINSKERLADAVHAIANKCLTRNEYDACSVYATAELASCSPSDSNCQRTSVINILDYCEDVCGGSDYTPFAVVQFLEGSFSARLAKRDVQPNNIQPAFVVGKKEFSASEVIDALALKQFIETRDRPLASLQRIEERLKPAVSSIRESLEQQPSELSISDSAAPEYESPKTLNLRRKRLVNNGGIANSFQIRLKDPQTGAYLPLPNSYRFVVPTSSSDPAASSTEFDTNYKYRLSFEDPVEDSQSPTWKFHEPDPVLRVTDASESRPTLSYDQDQTVVLYQDIPVEATTTSVVVVEEDLRATGHWGDMVKSILNFHAVDKDQSNAGPRKATSSNLNAANSTISRQGHTNGSSQAAFTGTHSIVNASATVIPAGGARDTSGAQRLAPLVHTVLLEIVITMVFIT